MIDAHVHVWDTAVVSYPWLTSHSRLNRPHLPSEIDDADGQVTSWVFVEADPAPPDAAMEIAWVQRNAWEGLVGVVAHLDLAACTAESLAELRIDQLIKGVRKVPSADEAPLAWSSSLETSFEILRAHAMTVDACVSAAQLPQLISALDRLPAATVVVDHLGKPLLNDAVTGPGGRAWQRALRRLARHPNVVMKLSGLPAEARSTEQLRTTAPGYLSAALDIFGSSRCMFGSDWPVSRYAPGGVCTGEWIDLVAAASAGHDESAVFEETARRVYRTDALTR